MNTTPKAENVTHAAGTCTYIRRWTSPWVASGGTTNSPMTTVAASPVSVAMPITRCAREPPSTVSARYRCLMGPLRSRCALNREQVLHEVVLLGACQVQMEHPVVVLDHGQQGREAAVVEEAALLVGPQPGQRSGAEHVRRRAVCLEAVDADRAWRNQIPARLGEDRRHVARRAFRRPVEQRLAAGCGHGVKRSLRRRGRPERQLVRL